jgi:crossover junction endodeoxyribonuclease RuvC
MRVLGIDPGSRVTGYAVVEANPGSGAPRYVECGVVQPRPGVFASRLQEILEGLREVISELRPAQVAVEGIFTHRNARSALLLGHARAMALVAAAESELPVYEYAPATVKLAVTGRGRASKEQVQLMVRVLCGLATMPPPDASDALAIALCHARRATHVARANVLKEGR